MKKDRDDKNKNSGKDAEIKENIEQIEENECVNDDENSSLNEEISRLKEDYLRVLAEAENIKKRCAAEIEKNNKYAIASFAKDLLVVADNLGRALQAGGSEPSGECEAILKGVELTQSELSHVFSKFGIEQMESIGKVFDPNFHRVVQEIEDASKPAGTVIAELQTGYLINGRILREAMVVVSKGGQ